MPPPDPHRFYGDRSGVRCGDVDVHAYVPLRQRLNVALRTHLLKGLVNNLSLKLGHIFFVSAQVTEL